MYYALYCNVLLYSFCKVNMSGTLDASSAELNAITVNTHLLCIAITNIVTIIWFSQKLEEGCLIAPQASNEIMSTAGISSYEKCHRLLNAVKIQVQADPSKFYKFLEILCSEGALQSFADMINASLTHRKL